MRDSSRNEAGERGSLAPIFIFLFAVAVIIYSIVDYGKKSKEETATTVTTETVVTAQK